MEGITVLFSGQSHLIGDRHDGLFHIYNIKSDISFTVYSSDMPRQVEATNETLHMRVT